MAWSVPVKGFLFLNSTGYVTPLPSGCAEFLNNDTYPQVKTISGENITCGLTSVATSGRDRNATYGKLAGFHFAEQAGSGTRVYRFDVPAGTYRIRIAQTDPDNVQTGAEILVKDGDGDTLLTLSTGTSLNLVRDAAGTVHASRAAWTSSNAQSGTLTVSSTYIELVCSYNGSTDYFLSYFEIEQLTQDPIVPTYYINGVGDETNIENGDGTAFQAVVNAASDGDDIRVDVAEVATITFSAKFTLPATSFTFGVRNMDTVHSVGTPIAVSKISQMITLKTSGSGTAPLFDCVDASRGIRWEGVVWDYAERTGNNVIVASPQATLTYDDAAQDAYLVEDQPDDWYFDRCIFKSKTFSTPSFRAVIWNGKTLTFSDCLAQTMTAQGGQNDGYWHGGDVGEGPILVQRCKVENVLGESQGFGTHGQRSGAGDDEVGDPGYQDFADNASIPLLNGYTMRSTQILRETSSRWACWTTTTPIAVSVGSPRTYTVPAGMPFAEDDPIQITDNTKTIEGVVISYSGTTLTAGITDVIAGTGVITGGAFVKRLNDEAKVKNMMEWTYGQDILVEGVYFRNQWMDFNNQNSAINIKLSTQKLASLDHVPMRRVTFRYCVFQSLAAWYTIADYFGTANSPAMTDFVFEHCLLFDISVYKHGAPNLQAIMAFGTDMPSNITIKNCLLDIDAQPTGLLGFGTSTYAHPSIANFTGHVWRNNVFIQQGNETYEIFGYYGTGPSASSSPKAYLENACTDVVFTHNSVVSSDHVTNWGSATKDGSNTWYTAAQRNNLRDLFRDPTNSTLTNRDYRYLAGSEQTGSDGASRGPDYGAMYEAMGWAWPFSWTPESTGRHRRRFFFLGGGGRRRRRRR